MTINSFYDGLTRNLFLGGVAAALIIFFMFRKANQVAATGNKAKMVGWSVAPALMVIVAVVAHGVAINVVWPRIQGAFASAPVQNTVALGDALTAAADSLLFGGGNGEFVAASVGPGAFVAPVMEASVAPVVNGGVVASFVQQPASIADNRETLVETAEQAVAAFNAMAVTPTPIGGGMTYINTFMADNLPTVEVKMAANGTYTVKGGDSLAKIAKAFYGDSGGWRQICDANRNVIRDCNNISAGMVLVIPAAGSNAQPSRVVSQPTAVSAWNQPKQTVYEQPATAPRRDLATNQVIINSNADAVQAIQALGPAPTVAPVVVAAPTPTPRSVYTYAELKGQAGVPGGGQAYIDQFLKTYGDNLVVADSGSSNP